MALATLSKRPKILTSVFEYRCTASTIVRTSENALFKAFSVAEKSKAGGNRTFVPRL
jgi:hypothetical protein